MAQLVHHARKIAAVSAVAVATGLPVVAVAQPAAAAAPAFTAYHSVTGRTHQARFDYLSRHGYRPISLAVAGASSPRYTAVWVKRSGPAFKAFHGYNAAAVQRYYRAAVRQGYQPTIIAATGAGSRAVFAGVFEKKRGKFYAYANLSAAKLAQHNRYAASHGYIPISVDAYGTTARPQYAGVWVANPRRVKWAVSVAKTAAGHHAYFVAQTRRGRRPSDVVVGAGLRYTSIWRSDKIGPWREYTGMSSAGYQRRFNDLKRRGFYPIQVSGGGTGPTARYAAIWAKN